MQPSSPISAYKQAEENDSPPIPSVRTSAHTQSDLVISSISIMNLLKGCAN